MKAALFKGKVFSYEIEIRLSAKNTNFVDLRKTLINTEDFDDLRNFNSAVFSWGKHYHMYPVKIIYSVFQTAQNHKNDAWQDKIYNKTAKEIHSSSVGR